jgi:hypothetical protein
VAADGGRYFDASMVARVTAIPTGITDSFATMDLQERRGANTS